MLKKTVQAFNSVQWTQSIISGELALKACRTHFSENNPLCINTMRNNALAYQQADVIHENAEKIERAYRVALSQLGPMHYTTIKTREIFYQLAIAEQRYSETIPLVIAFIHHERTNNNDAHKILDWFMELDGLYKKTNQVQYEEPSLESIVSLTEKTYGIESNNFKQSVSALAKCYCGQKKYTALSALRDQYSLEINCD
ncbi:hypothetical protein N9W57_07565 [Pseudomonadales bacterium]|nr:hypothetical protein [Pseudomonadales bacterium]